MKAAPVSEIGRLLGRRADLLRELADLEIEIGVVFEAGRAAGPTEPGDAVLSLLEAAGFMGEPASTFRRRPEYQKALVSRPTERRRRYSRRVLLEIKEARLEASAMVRP